MKDLANVLSKTGLVLLALAVLGFLGYIAVQMMSARNGIEAVNRSARPVYAYEVDKADQGKNGVGTGLTRIASGAQEGVTAEYDPVGCWVVFLGAKKGKPLAVVSIRSEDRKGEDYVVIYPPPPGRSLPIPSDLVLPWSGN